MPHKQCSMDEIERLEVAKLHYMRMAACPEDRCRAIFTTRLASC